MAAGKPVVATPVGGVSDAVTDGLTGILVPLDDPVALAGALRRIEADSLLHARLGEKGREAARLKFHQSIVIEKLSECYEMLADRRRSNIGAY